MNRREDRHASSSVTTAFEGVAHARSWSTRGLNVPQVTELRRQVRAARGRATGWSRTRSPGARLKGTPFEPLERVLPGTTAIAYTGTDPVALAKTLTTFAKTARSWRSRRRWCRGGQIQAAEVTELAALPGKPELYAQAAASCCSAADGPARRPSSTRRRRRLLNVLAQAEKKKGEA